MRRKLKTAAGFIAGLAIIAVFIYSVGWERLLSTLYRVDIGLMVPGAFFSLLIVFMFGIAWWFTVRETTGLSFIQGIKTFYAAHFANSITPLGQFGGEPFIAYVLHKRSGIPLDKAFGAAVAADVVNAFQFFTISVLGLFTYTIYFGISEGMDTVFLGVLSAIIALSIFLSLLWYRKDAVIGFLGWTGSKLEDIGEETAGFLSIVEHWDQDWMEEKGERFYLVMEGLLTRKKEVSIALFFSHIAGFSGIAAVFFLLRSLGSEISFIPLILILPASMLANYLPLPGGVGGVEFALISFLVALGGVSPPVAAASVLLFRLFSYWVNLFIGGLSASTLSVKVFYSS
ncbi:MAG: flippase-like domain-containing protein [Candidatus Nanohaloarchaeota archaeon QJJ-9]|nr:flippase-like domain-containing protein [Candidatus Nanohaloarchaeota archaeon QJJ-9]